MPHLRQRACFPALLKKLAFSPVVAIQGARQTGKSVLIRELLKKNLPNLKFVSFDEAISQDFAFSNPDSFLAQFDSDDLVAIDEAQKVPRIFDAVKLQVDTRKRPGMYLLLGSTEFSKLTKIRESLTGRMSKLRLFPLTLAECHQLSLREKDQPLFFCEKSRISRANIMEYLRKGGLPGLFSIRSKEEHESLLRDWLDLTLERDLMQIPGLKLIPTVARKILIQIAQLSEPTAGEISRVLRMNIRSTHRYLKALETLFVVHTLNPHFDGTGKPVYFLFDVSLTTLLGGSFERQLHTLLIQEMFAKFSYLGIRDQELYYYRGPKGGIIHLVIEGAKKRTAVKILSEERMDKRELMGLLAWKKKNPSGSTLALGAQRISLKKEHIEMYPWEALG